MTPIRVGQPVWERIVPQEDGCWLWQGATNSHGYGQVRIKQRLYYVHRWVYEQSVGPIPDGLVIDHACNTRACCNPDHLRVMTQRANVQRTRRSHCPRGHAMTEENSYYRPDGNGRMCAACCELRTRSRAS